MPQPSKKRTTKNSNKSPFAIPSTPRKPTLLRHPLRQTIPTTSSAPELSLPLPKTPSRVEFDEHFPEITSDIENPFEINAPPPSVAGTHNSEASELSYHSLEELQNITERLMTSTSTETLKGKAREVERDPIEDQVAGLMDPINENTQEEASPGIEYPDEVLYRCYRIEPLKPISDYYKGDYSGIPQSTISQNPEVRITSFYEEDGSVPMEYVSFTGNSDYRNIPEEHRAYLRDRRKEAVRYGSQFLNRPALLNFEVNALSRTERKQFKAELDLLGKFLTHWREVTVSKEEIAYAVVPDSYVDLLKALRRLLIETRIDFQVQGIPPPDMPVWGKNALVAQWWNFNDLECIAACWRIQVENFLAEVARNTERPLESNQTHPSKAYQGKGQTFNTIPIVSGDPGSISQFREVRTAQYNTLRGTLRSQGRPDLNTNRGSSSRQFAEEFRGVAPELHQPDLGREDVISNASRSSFHSNRRRGEGRGPPFDPPGGDPGDEPPHGPPRGPPGRGGPGDPGSEPPRGPLGRGGPGDPGDDPFGGDGGYNSGRRRRELDQRSNQPGNTFNEVPRFDIKLKPDLIPTWDGDMEKIITWETQLNDLAKRSSIVRKQLGYLVPTRLQDQAENWYYSLSERRRTELEVDWPTLRNGINRYYMNRKWMDDQKISANKATYRDSSHTHETPSEYFIRKKELLMRVYDYSDTQLIQEIMEGAPTAWINVVTPHLYTDVDEFQEVIKFHENSLMALSRPYRGYWSQENSSPYKNSAPTKARVNLIGSSPNLPPPQFPKDDSNVSKKASPEEKGLRPCRHCGSGKHWDYECKYARKGVKRARMNHIVTTPEDIQAQQEYDDAYYDLSSDDELEKEDF
ncbi:hypothetical protein F5878DRAFT_666765 [Lentinula raphanica]|uniref:Retrotransposon gag domain-containing protein n=1 Tax=Lentinula raphanica TaxID=153919 RepID=A0AA38NXE4_9AGAR|nr:hypothetical protein F5878DRAFT_666765 [Lentinula raphanica]